MFALESRFRLVAGAAFACCYLEFNAGDRLTLAARRSPLTQSRRSGYDGEKTENRMRAFILAVLMMTASAALADDVTDAHRQAVSGRDSYWNCLAQEYSRDTNKGMSGPDFTSLIARACPSERQNFRVTLVDFLSLQFPDIDAGAHMTTANNAIAAAQKDVVTAFVNHKAAAK